MDKRSAKGTTISYGGPIKVLCDNKSVISIAHDLLFHDSMKQVNIDQFYIKEKREDKVPHKTHVSTMDQFVDKSTKGLPAKTLSTIISKLGMKAIHSCA